MSRRSHLPDHRKSAGMPLSRVAERLAYKSPLQIANDLITRGNLSLRQIHQLLSPLPIAKRVEVLDNYKKLKFK